MSFQPTKAQLRRIFDELSRAYGPMHWWPGDTAFEIMVGAVLTQNTAWTNVERAIANLKAADCMDARVIVACDIEELAQLLRPSGYFNVKAKRLRSYCEYLLRSGGIAALSRHSTEKLRLELLAVHGIGPETADDILLYAFDRPVFVIDAYTRRLFGRLGHVNTKESYESLRRGFESALGPDTAMYNEYHALIVRHAKEVCRPKPLCGQCCLKPHCVAGRSQV